MLILLFKLMQKMEMLFQAKVIGVHQLAQSNASLFFSFLRFMHFSSDY